MNRRLQFTPHGIQSRQFVSNVRLPWTPMPRQGVPALQQLPASVNDALQLWSMAVNFVKQQSQVVQLHGGIKWAMSASQTFADPRFLFLRSMRELHNTITTAVQWLIIYNSIIRQKTNSTRNTLDSDQPNYSSSTVLSHIPIVFGPTGNSAIRSADPENHTL